MVTAVFRLKAELTLFLRMCTKEIFKKWWKCIPTENPGRRSEWRGQTFDQKLLSNYFYAREVKMCQKLAYPVVKSPTS